MAKLNDFEKEVVTMILNFEIYSINFNLDSRLDKISIREEKYNDFSFDKVKVKTAINKEMKR